MIIQRGKAEAIQNKGRPSGKDPRQYREEGQMLYETRGGQRSKAPRQYRVEGPRVEKYIRVVWMGVRFVCLGVVTCNSCHFIGTDVHHVFCKIILLYACTVGFIKRPMLTISCR